MTGIFKKNDIRGIYPSELNDENIEKIGFVFAQFLGSNSRVAIAIDSRLSSSNVRNALIRGMNRNRIITFDLGLGPTPLTYFVAKLNEEIDAAIMITASHNPKDWNGIKFCNSDGLSYNYENLYKMLEEKVKNIELQTTELNQDLIRNGSHLSFQYFDYLENKFSYQSKLKILIEYGNGSVGKFTDVLEKLGCITKSIRKNPDGNFPTLIPDPTKEKTFEEIKIELDLNQYDIAIAFDGDGDRVGFMLPNKELISPDKVVMLFANDIIMKKGSVLVLMDVKMSSASKEYIEKKGGKVLLTQTGHSWVHKKLIETNADLAAELSSHYYFEDEYYGYDDGLFSALRMLVIIDNLKKKGKNLSEVIQELPSYQASPEYRMAMSEDRQDKIIEELKAFAIENDGQLIEIDGIRGEFNHGWFLARKSGTESALSFRIEGKTELDFNELKNQVLTIINDN
ncbi:MAG: Phosphomannomutase/phosphoglucomutase [Candidatus Heimdallarchaeota archaeon LC_2]|nr:MAG: Phosphomannomutase/phosphoglucomutase [Candidatus Heimdallarchaeota archaeon LC_2]